MGAASPRRAPVPHRPGDHLRARTHPDPARPLGNGLLRQTLDMDRHGSGYPTTVEPKHRARGRPSPRARATPAPRARSPHDQTTPRHHATELSTGRGRQPQPRPPRSHVKRDETSRAVSPLMPEKPARLSSTAAHAARCMLHAATSRAAARRGARDLDVARASRRSSHDVSRVWKSRRSLAVG